MPENNRAHVVIRGVSIVTQRLVLESVQQILHIAFQIEESSVASAPCLRFLQGRRCSAHADAFGFRSGISARDKHGASFKQANIVRATIEVVCQHIEHAGDQRTPHHGRFLTLRIRQFNHARR